MLNEITIKKVEGGFIVKFADITTTRDAWGSEIVHVNKDTKRVFYKLSDIAAWLLGYFKIKE